MITKDMIIGDLVEEHPELVEQFLSYGVHCVGCGASYYETIEQGLMIHGKTPEEIKKIVEELNKNLKS